MKRLLTSALGLTLGLLPICVAGADEIEWRAATPKQPTVKQVSVPSVPTPAMPVASATRMVPSEDSIWRKAPMARGQSPDKQLPELPMPRRLSTAAQVAAPDLSMTVHDTPLSQPVTRTYPITGSRAHVEPKHFGSPELTLVKENLLGLDPLVEGYSPQVWASAEYLLWWMTPANLPAAATTNSIGQQPILGNPGTSLLLGPTELGSGARSGARFRAGAWLDDCKSCGVDASFFFLGPVSESFAFDSSRLPIIGRPFFAVNRELNQQFIETVAFPGVSTGRFDIDYDSFLWGGDINIRECLFTTCDSKAEAFVGYRYLNLDETIRYREVLTAGANNAQTPPGSLVTVQDSFHTNSQFHGGQVGINYEKSLDRLIFSMRGSVALGVTQNLVDVNGSATLQAPGGLTQVATGGLLALDSNIGRRTQNEFSVVPELSLNVGYQFTDHFRGFFGYNFLYWNNIVRPGDQIDTGLDVTRIPFFLPASAAGTVSPVFPPRPAPIYQTSDLWVNGLNFGMEYRW